MSRPERILCLDTSTTTARVAVIGGAAPASAEVTADRHSAHVLRLCDQVLREAGLKAAELDAVACGAGPGSFTGLRVALAVSKGVAVATGARLLLVSSLEALALDILALPDVATAVPCIDAGKGEVYAGLYRAGGPTGAVGEGEAWRLTPADLATRLGDFPGAVVAGGGADRHAAVLDAALRNGARRVSVAGPTAASVARLALPRLRRGESDDLDTAVPLYGRPPDITLKKARTP